MLTAHITTSIGWCGALAVFLAHALIGVLFKLVLTAVATIVLLSKLGPIGLLADAASNATFSSSDLVGIRTSLTLHAAAGLVVLLAAIILAIYKPAGLVRREPLASGTAYALPLCSDPAAACMLQRASVKTHAPSSVKRKTAPAPSSDSPETQPPWRCAILRTIARPMPVPANSCAACSR